MIHLTESIIAVRVPVEAENFQLMTLGKNIITGEKVFFVTWGDCPSFERMQAIGNFKEEEHCELLGVIGAGEEIPEELAKSILQAMEILQEVSHSRKYSDMLAHILKNKEIDLTKEKIVLIKIG